MKKRLLAICLCVLTILSFSQPVFAFGESEHSEYVEEVLFGNKEYKKAQSDDIKEKISVLEDACTICADQYNGYYQDKLNHLKNYGVKGIPLYISEINFTDNAHHRRYTHRGWDFAYSRDSREPYKNRPNTSNWQVRKKILNATVNKVFGFRSDFGMLFTDYPSQCKDFSALLYYIHIIADYIDSTSTQIDNDMIPLATLHPGESNRDVFWEIEDISKRLFKSQKGSFIYAGFLSELNTLAEDTRALQNAAPGGINDKTTPELFEEYHNNAEKLMDIMKTYIPKLLAKEDFFKDVFYKNT